MPSFACSLLSAHLGFIEGCLSLNELAADPVIFRDLTSAVINKRKHGNADNFSIHQATLEFLERACNFASDTPTAEQIAESLGSITMLSEEAIRLYIECRAEKAASDVLTSLPKNGKLLDLQWRLGLAIESSAGKNLNAIYVTLSFKVLDSHNRETIHTLELPYLKFQEFVNSIRDATNAMYAL